MSLKLYHFIKCQGNVVIYGNLQNPDVLKGTNFFHLSLVFLWCEQSVLLESFAKKHHWLPVLTNIVACLE